MSRMKTATVYECGFCGTFSESSAYIKGHEKRCYANPTLRACKSCMWWFKNHPEFGKKSAREGPLPFCSNPDHDYAAQTEWVDPGWEIPTGNLCQRDCEGWKERSYV